MLPVRQSCGFMISDPDVPGWFIRPLDKLGDIHTGRSLSGPAR